MTPHEPFAPQFEGPYVAPRNRLRSVAFVVGGIWLTIVALVCVIAAGRDVDELACNLGFPWNCASVGLLYASQAQQWQDPSRAARAAVFLEKACEGGVDNACNSLGVLYARGRGVKKDEVRAAALYQRACSGGSLIACSNLGSAQLDGRGVEEEIELAITNFKRACDGGYAGGCNHLGWVYGRGHGAEKDERRAAELFGRAGDGGYAVADSYHVLRGK